MVIHTLNVNKEAGTGISCKFKVSLAYLVSSWLARDIQGDPVSNKHTRRIEPWRNTVLSKSLAPKRENSTVGKMFTTQA